jgi:hypothetical protein
MLLRDRTVPFFQEALRAHNHATADDRDGAGMKDPRWYKLEFEGLAASDNGMTGVVAARESDDHISLAAEDVNQFSFGFIAPLRPNNYEC